MKEKLKPCPFCGAEPIMNRALWPDTDYIIKCDNFKCNVELTTFAYPKDKVIEIWNTRKEEESVNKEND